MKLIVNKGVRETMEELQRLFERYDAICGVLAARGTSNSVAMDAGLDKHACETAIVGTAAKILSHATRGKLHPMTTEGTYGTRGRW